MWRSLVTGPNDENFGEKEKIENCFEFFMSNRLKKLWTSKSNKIKKHVAVAMSESKKIIDEQNREKSMKNNEQTGNKLTASDGATDGAQGKLTTYLRQFNHALMPLLSRSGVL